jgi:predicted transcriptional regulator
LSSIKSDEEIDDLLNHTNNSLHKVNVQVKIIGSGNHGNQINDNKRAGHQDRDKDNHATVAVLAELIGGKSTSELLNVHPAIVSKYRNGKNGNNDIDPELIAKTEAKLEGITRKTVDKVDQLLEIFAEDKMEELKAAEIPSAAEKLINMVDKINRRHDKELGDNMKPQVILYAPKQININEYLTKEV